MEELESGELVRFLQSLLRQACTHRFSWPRIGENGRHYQVCLACGTAYEYDWEIMRRTNRLFVQAVHNELHGSRLSH